MTFQKYMHLERFGTDEVDGINLGECHVFPKLDELMHLFGKLMNSCTAAPETESWH